MEKALIILLLGIIAFGSCKKENEIERVQSLMIGTYDMNCTAIGPVFDTLNGSYIDTFYYTKVWEINKADNGNIVFAGDELELIAKDNPYYYQGRLLFLRQPTLTFVNPDSVIYHTYAGGHTGTYIDCTGKKQ